jgi:hypothetical protein
LAEKKPLIDRALAALDVAFDDAIKGQFDGFLGDDAGGEPRDRDVARHERGLREIKDVYGITRGLIEKVFGDAP